jgi:hypothetical protein
MTDPNPGVILVDRELVHDLLRLPETLRVTGLSLGAGLLYVEVEGPGIDAPINGEPRTLTPVYKRLDDGHVVLQEILGLHE